TPGPSCAIVNPILIKVAVAVDLMPTAFPKGSPALVNYNLYILFSVKEILFLSFVYIHTNSIATRKNLSMTYQEERARDRQMSCFFFTAFFLSYLSCSDFLIFSFRRARAFLQSSSTTLFSPTTLVSVPSALLFISMMPSS